LRAWANLGELQGCYRVNVVSPTIVEDSADEYGHLFPELPSVSMTVLVDHYVESVEGTATGQSSAPTGDRSSASTT
jgi:hypothetical protein